MCTGRITCPGRVFQALDWSSASKHSPMSCFLGWVWVEGAVFRNAGPGDLQKMVTLLETSRVYLLVPQEELPLLAPQRYCWQREVSGVNHTRPSKETLLFLPA